jgi:hypothetical protein
MDFSLSEGLTRLASTRACASSSALCANGLSATLIQGRELTGIDPFR